MELKAGVGIIGAGVAGLATAKTLQGQGLDCTIFERAERIDDEGINFTAVSYKLQ